MMERATLESFLAPISRQLGHEDVPQHVEPLDYAKNPPARRTDGLSHARLVDMFADESEKIRVGVHRCKSAEVAKVIKDIIKADGEPGSVVFADDHRIGRLEVPQALEKCKKVTSATRWDASAGRDAMVDACNAARYGITFAKGGIAETGTIVQLCDESCGRAISLLPLVHIAIVNAADVKATMGDWLAELDEEGAPAGDNLPSQICFISGPSATADIELVRVEGVHGPMFVHYVIIEGRGLHSLA